MENKNEHDPYKLVDLLEQLNANIRFYERLPLQDFKEHDTMLLSRLKMQKDLFIKEVNKIFNLDQPDSINIKSSIQNDGISPDSHIQDAGPASDGAESWIHSLRTIENELLDRYNTLLLDPDLSEIAHMILRNHTNEITRDLQSLQEIKEKRPVHLL